MKCLSLLILSLASFSALAEMNMCFNPPSVVEHPFFYRMTRGRTSGYILGTLHVGVPFSAMPEVVKRALDLAPVGIGETGNAPRPVRKFNEWRANGVIARGSQRPLSELLNAEEYAILLRHVLDGGFPESLLQNLSPVGGGLVLNYGGPERRMGELDNEITARFVALKKTVLGLESEFLHVGLMRKVFTLENLKQQLPVFEQQSAANCRIFWTGDETALEADILNGGPDDQFVEKLINARNRNWIPRIEKILRRYPGAFFFVGGAHLPGAKGVLHLLEQRGFKIERVNSPPAARVGDGMFLEVK